MPKIAIIQFPGVNSEYETARSVESAGGTADIVRFNAPSAMLHEYSGYILPGGFAYEDRVRAGAIAAKDDVMEIVSQAVTAGKPVLGICNGAQVLVESGLVPGEVLGNVEMSLAPNKTPGRQGFYSKWIYVKNEKTGEVLPMPIDHAEGRFTSNPATVEKAVTAGLVNLSYVDNIGGKSDGYNPNGSDADIAALGAYTSSAIAVMPHPERANWLFQVPIGISGNWGYRRRNATPGDLYGPGPGRFMFDELVTRAKQ